MFLQSSTCEDGHQKVKDEEHLEKRQVLQLAQPFVCQSVEEWAQGNLHWTDLEGAA